jgi:hypothetical protein
MTILHVPEQHGEDGKVGFHWRVLVWVAKRVLPRANLDYDVHFDQIAYWLVEVNDQGQAEREIGFSAQQEPLMFAPTDRNYGMWTDSDRIFGLEQLESRNDFPFDSTWNNLYAQTLQGTSSL